LPYYILPGAANIIYTSTKSQLAMLGKSLKSLNRNLFQETKAALQLPEPVMAFL